LNNSIQVPQVGYTDFFESEFTDIKEGICNSWVYYNLIHSWGYIRRNHRNTLQTNGETIWSYKNPIAIRIGDVIYINDLTSRSGNWVSQTTSNHVYQLARVIEQSLKTDSSNESNHVKAFKILHPYEFAALVRPCERPFDQN